MAVDVSSEVPIDYSAIQDVIEGIPQDRYGRKADKLSVHLGGVDLDRTSAEDVELFKSLEKGSYVELRIRAFVVSALEDSREDENGEEDSSLKRVLKVKSLEAA